MELLTCLILLSVASVTANSYSRQTNFKITLENIPICQIFQEIEQNSEFKFIYSEKSVDVNRKVDVKVIDETVNTILEQLFKGTNNYYEIHDQQIVILSPEKTESQPEKPIDSDQNQTFKRRIKGKVEDVRGEPVPGATILVKGTSVGTITDFEGNFTIDVPSGAKTIVATFVGMKPQEVLIGVGTSYSIVLEEQTVGLEEVVAVGYGTQKKNSLVASIDHVSSKEIMKAAPSAQILSKTLTGLMPGLTIVENPTGAPGREKSKIIIRSITSWNGSDPYILVDGVERDMENINPSDVESISILKDASATAVYGVKGANGVILVTTKQGIEGAPKITASSDVSIKYLCRRVRPLASYEANLYKNIAVENEISAYPSEWSKYVPEKVMAHIRDKDMPDIFPDINWQEYIMPRPALTKRFNTSVSGGTSFVKYFGSLSYYVDDDLISMPKIDRGIDDNPRFSFNRINFTTNLDFLLSKTTTLSTKLSGYRGEITSTVNNNNILQILQDGAPNSVVPIYPDGTAGANPNYRGLINPIRDYNYSGIVYNTSYYLNSNFILSQDLSKITKGLNLKAQFGYDNIIGTTGPKATDLANNNTLIQKYVDGEKYLIDRDLEKATIWYNLNTSSQFSPTNKNASWESTSEQFGGSLQKNLMYQFALNWSRTFHRHDLSATAVMNRQKNSNSASFPSFKEDWVGRVTYGFDNKYMTEINMAYNGSEKFGSKYRFGFFPSLALGWIFSEEKCMKEHLKFISYGKVRYSNGYVGSDAGISAYLYRDQWAKSSNNYGFGYPVTAVNPLQIVYSLSQIGNPNAHWETNHKQNVGLETKFLNGLLSFNADYYWERRTGIFMSGNLRTSIPDWFGAPAVAANLGETVGNGLELELRIDKTLRNWKVFANANWTLNRSKVIYKEEAEMKPFYQKEEGYRIGQLVKPLSNGLYNSWDDVYSSVVNPSDQKLIPGTFKVIDYNASGNIEIANDEAPTGFTISPQNTASLTLGTAYKGFDFSIQLYSSYNVSGWNEDLREFSITPGVALIYPINRDEAWTPEKAIDGTAKSKLLTTVYPATYGDYIIHDYSYIRIQNLQLGYSFSSKLLKQIGITMFKTTLIGNNLITWNNLPHTMAPVFSGRGGLSGFGASAQGNYPSISRVTLSINLTF